MPITTETPNKNSLFRPEPTIWQRYSPHSEFPLASAASLAVHTLLVLLFVVAGLWLFGGGDDEGNKPPRMDLVEIEGEGGGLGGLGVGPGKLNIGQPGRTEGAENAKGAGKSAAEKKFDENVKLKDLPKYDLTFKPVDGPIVDEGDIFGQLEVLQQQIDKMWQAGEGKDDKRAGFTGGDKIGKSGGAGGAKGPGIGTGKGAGKGNSPTGVVFTEWQVYQKRWHFDWDITDSNVALKKLQALEVKLVLPLKSKKGFALQYDLSNPRLVAATVKFVHDKDTVWYLNKNPREVIDLATALKLSEVPTCSIIYLPTGLVGRMAKIEQKYSENLGRREHDIEATYWDLSGDGAGGYYNEPYIKGQKLRAGVK
jgi:hypothetical protein